MIAEVVWLPENDLLWVEDLVTKKRLRVVPGELRRNEGRSARCGRRGDRVKLVGAEITHLFAACPD
jgi:hypothetical protein